LKTFCRLSRSAFISEMRLRVCSSSAAFRSAGGLETAETMFLSRRSASAVKSWSLRTSCASSPELAPNLAASCETALPAADEEER
jgi:hypothetical protein